MTTTTLKLIFKHATWDGHVILNDSDVILVQLVPNCIGDYGGLPISLGFAIFRSAPFLSAQQSRFCTSCTNFTLAVMLYKVAHYRGTNRYWNSKTEIGKHKMTFQDNCCQWMFVHQFWRWIRGVCVFRSVKANCASQFQIRKWLTLALCTYNEKTAAVFLPDCTRSHCGDYRLWTFEFFFC